MRMNDQNETFKQLDRKKKESSTFLTALFRIAGMMLISLVILCTIPTSVPRMLGLEVYQIVSGSMEPKLPVGSVVYMKKVDPADLQAGEIAVFYSNETTIVHRVVENHVIDRQIITKGDANEKEDMLPIPYERIQGKVVYSAPKLGMIFMFLTSKMGKIYLFSFLIAGILCHIISRILKAEKKAENTPKETESDENQEMNHIRKKVRRLQLLCSFVGLALLVVAGLIGKTHWNYQKEKNHNIALAKEVISMEKPPVETEESEESITSFECPISVNFEELKAINPDIIGWIYCEDTMINYPICHTVDDDFYLSHSYDGKLQKSGSIFLETINDIDFSDANMFLYGHHMKDGTMFSGLSRWAKQEYYEEHPIMWLLTPDATYMIQLYAGYVTSATSDTYIVYDEFCEEASQYFQKAYLHSLFRSQLSFDEIVEPYGNEPVQHIVLSTCDYSYENARFVLHGRLLKKI